MYCFGIYHTKFKGVDVIVHIAKYTKKQAMALLSHYEDENYRRHSSSVNPERTKYNITYSIDGEQKKGQKRLKELLNRDDVFCLNRADVKVMFDTVITAPQNLPRDREIEFFNYAVKFLSEKFPQAYMITINIHYDENSYYDKDSVNGVDNSGKQFVRPHCHIAMAPTVFDKKHNRYKISCKDTITKETLITLHQDFKKYIDKAMNLDLEIINGATANGNKTILELKNQELEKKVASQQEEIEKLKQLKNKLQNQIEYELIR